MTSSDTLERFAPIKSKWSDIDVTDFGPYREARAAALARSLWLEPGKKDELFAKPKSVLSEALGLDFGAADVQVIDKATDEFVFVLPRIPPKDELWYRYEQISGWWMFAHAMWWWMVREHGEGVAPYLNALNVQIIGRSWNDAPWRQAMIDDPRATLEAEIKASFPPRLKVRSVVDSDDVIHFVPPPHPKDEDLSEVPDRLAGLFAVSHTWWQWLVWPKLLSPAKPGVVTGMVG